MSAQSSAIVIACANHVCSCLSQLKAVLPTIAAPEQKPGAHRAHPVRDCTRTRTRTSATMVQTTDCLTSYIWSIGDRRGIGVAVARNMPAKTVCQLLFCQMSDALWQYQTLCGDNNKSQLGIGHSGPVIDYSPTDCHSWDRIRKCETSHFSIQSLCMKSE